MLSTKAIAWIERMIWILIYAGLFAVVLGLATMSRSPAFAWTLIVIGGAAAAAGVVLVWVRSRVRQAD